MIKINKIHSETTSIDSPVNESWSTKEDGIIFVSERTEGITSRANLVISFFNDCIL